MLGTMIANTTNAERQPMASTRLVTRGGITTPASDAPSTPRDIARPRQWSNQLIIVLCQARLPMQVMPSPIPNPTIK